MVLSQTGGVGRRLLMLAAACGAVFVLGACSSEEAATEEEGFDQGTSTQTPQKEETKEASGDQQALTSFIGGAPKKETKQEVQKTEPTTQPTAKNELEELRTENTSLKQKVVKLEQDVRTLSARLSDTEAKYMAEKERADKAEQAAKVASQSAVLSARGSDMSSSTTSMSAYEDALKTFNAKQYDSAVAKLQGMISSGVSNDLADNVHYWLGEANFGKKKYKEAMKHFETVFEYKNSEKLADAQYMLAQCYERTGNKAKAKEAYEKVVKDFPTSHLVKRAKDRWARL